jgi:methyltransferase (TIGR00027 family)
MLLAAVRSGITQLVLLGAGYDSRAFRFARELEVVRIFEVDHPGTQARKKRLLARAGRKAPANVCFIPVDFTRQCFKAALAQHGFSPAKKTLFLWEGVSYYLPQPVVEDVLDFVAGCGPGSSIVFDYATRAFVDGDTSTFGGKQVARWLERIGEPFLFGLDATETGAFLQARGLQLVSDLCPADQERSYLETTDGALIGRTFGHVRMAHARV